MKAHSKRRSVAAAASIAAILTMAACGNGGQESPSPEGTTTEPAEVVEELVVWAFSSQVAAQIVENFPSDHPEYDLEVVEIPIADLSQRLVVALQGGDALPDIVQLPLRESGGLFATGQFMDLTAELGPLENEFPEGILLRSDGEINAFTMGPGNMGFWVNVEKLAEHDLQIPQDPTWDDVVNVARDLRDASDGSQYLFVQPPANNGANMFNAFFHSRGGNWWGADGELVVDEALAVDTLTWMVDLHREGLVYQGVWTDPTYWDSIRSGEIVGWTMNYGVGSSNLQLNVPEQSGEWRLFTWPRWSPEAEQLTGAFGGSLFAGLRNATNQQGARDFIMWWLSDNGLQIQHDVLGLVPYGPAADVVDLDSPDPYFGDQAVALELASVPYPEFHYFNWPATESALTYAVDQAYSGALSPEEAIAEAIRELEAQ